jgi:iron complex outermembrane recepter protein
MKLNGINTSLLAALLVIFIGGWTSQSVHAQLSKSLEIEEVLVTATMRSENLQNLGFSISSVNGDTLHKLGASGTSDYLNSVPGASFIDLGPGISQLNFRGAYSNPVSRDAIDAKEGVGVYFDDVPVSQAFFNPDLDTFDVDRIEVLRGPQGTLYGAGSMSGTVRIILNKPDSTALAGVVNLGLGTITDGGTEYETKAAVNVPLVKNRVAVRAVVYENHYGGFIDSVNASNDAGTTTLGIANKDYNDGDKAGGRLSFRFQGEYSDTVVNFIYQKIEMNGLPYDDFFNDDRRAGSGGVFESISVTTGEYQAFREVDELHRDEFFNSNVNLTYRLGGVSLVSVSSFVDRKLATDRDFTMWQDTFDSFGPWMTDPTGAVTVQLSEILPSTARDRTDFQSFSQEFRLISTTDDPLQWIGGVFIANSQRDYFQHIYATGWDAMRQTSFPGFSPGIVNSTTDVWSDWAWNVKLQQTAVFGELSYDIANAFNVTLGARFYDVEQNTFGGFSGDLASTLDIQSLVSTQREDANDSGVSPKVMASWNVTDNVLLAVQVARGFRLGGSNATIPTNCSAADLSRVSGNGNSYESEFVWNYELGIKSTWLNDRVMFNASVYQLDYDDMQIQIRLPSCSFSLVANAGEAETTGAELEWQFRISHGLTLQVRGAYIDAEITADVPQAGVTKGTRLPGSAEKTYGVSIDYQRSIGQGLTFFGFLDYRYNGDLKTFINDTDLVPEYEFVNLRLGVNLDKWEISAYANNLLNEYAAVSLERELGGDSRKSYSVLQPRTYGVSAKILF